MNRTRTRRIGLLLAVMLLLSLLSGCGMLDVLPLVNEESGDKPIRMNYQGTEPIDMVPFSEMEYVRPDGDAILAQYDDLIAALATRTRDDDDVEQTYTELDAIYTAQYEFITMRTLAEIHSDLDQSDKTWTEEMRYCTDLSVELSQKHEELLYACAASRQSRDIEDYLGEGSLDAYQGEYTYPDELMRLRREESRLKNEYYEVYADFVLVYDGEEYGVGDFINAAYDGEIDLTPEQAADYYYGKLNEAVAPIFVELVKVRQQIAAESGYDSYIAYAYDTNGRDYTPEEVHAYTEAIVRELVPLYVEVVRSGIYDDANATDRIAPAKALALVDQAANAMGGYQQEAMRFMRAYELVDVNRSPKKYSGSYEMYIENYESPFVFVNSTGYLEDVLTIAHEFGRMALRIVARAHGVEPELALADLRVLPLQALRRGVADVRPALVAV